ncbi:DNA excision repair protein ERCC-6-like 2 [Haliotis asinina]|uniref:DNA excision repair protein ERCC-6-like 2 n=1 Tax=Haliotis asinina TaxID=109174 RepID=UPI0035320F4F
MPRSSDEEEGGGSKQKVWTKGEKCLAPYSGDGELYKACIKEIHHRNGKGIYAVVKFDEYDSDENEEVPIDNLQATKQKSVWRKIDVDSAEEDDAYLEKSMFKPLRGNEEYLRLEGKFKTVDSDSDEDWQSHAPKTKGKVSEWKMSLSCEKGSQIKSHGKKKTVVAIGGRKKNKDTPKNRNIGVHDSQEASTSTRQIEDTGTNRTDVKSVQRSNKSTTCTRNEDEFTGFTEDDMEKPKFSFTLSASKVPFLLSEQGETPVVQVPAPINQYLRDYQREGIKFLYSHYREGRGAILGDDMGLGKTVQVIGLLAALLHKQGNRMDVMRQKPKFIRELSDTSDQFADMDYKPFLIIGPGSVLYNWLDELDTWGYFSASKFHGSDKKTCLAEVKKGKLEVVVTTFETFRDNMELLDSVDWEAVIVDEVHRIKGLKAQTTQALRCLHTKKRYGLTGTALQNNMTELWSILDWAQPNVMGGLYEFETDFVQVIERGQRHDATKRELAMARKKKEEFSNKRTSMMIRRTKMIIADQLPEKDDNVVFCKLMPLQESVYRAVLGHPDMSLVLRMDDPCDCESSRTRSKCCYKVSPEGHNITSVMFSFMHLLLKTANHVALLTPHANSSLQQLKRTKEVCKIAFKDHPQFLEQSREASFRTLSDPKYCGKMKVLQGLLSVFHKTHSKVLVFSYSTRLLDILEQYIISDGHEYRRIDGTVNNRRRMDIVREFNKDPNIFVCLISTKAGGLGLNLTGANKVVIFDPNWNPSHDLQAQDRAYRIGQRKNVNVYRLISVGTIEENIYLRQMYKQQLGSVAVASENATRFFHGIQGDRFHKGELFGVKNMFQIRTGDSCLTMDILERNQKVETGLRGFQVSKYIAPPSIVTEETVEDEDFSDNANLESDDEESEDALRHLLGSDNDSGLDIASPPPSPPSKTKPQASVKKRSAQRNTKTATRHEVVKELSTPDASVNQSFTSINSVFEKCGVMHVHENPKVVGASRAENYMSRCAIQDVYELHQNSQAPAMEVDPYSDSSEDETPTPPQLKKGGSRGRGRGRKAGPDHNTPKAIEHGSCRVLIGQTPAAIRRQHFAKMADCESADQLALAETILRGDAASRLQMLREFYTQEHPHLEEVVNTSLTIIKTDESSVLSSNVKKTNSVIKGQERKTASKSQTKGRPKKSKQGLTFMDFDDSESQSIPQPKPGPSRLDHDESDLSSMEVGKAISPRGATTRMRTPRGRWTKSQGQSLATKTVVESDFGSLFESVPQRLNKQSKEREQKPTDTELTFSETVNVDEVKVPFIRDEGSNVDELLFQIGREKEKKLLQDAKEDDDQLGVSILDDLFTTSTSQRKPAPPKAKKNENSCDLFSPESSTSEKDADFTSDLLNESTLADDSIDCFSEHKKWKKRKASPGKTPGKSPGRRVQRLLQESTDDFEKLLESGKLRKKHPKSSRKNLHRDFDDLDGIGREHENKDSASLFS